MREHGYGHRPELPARTAWAADVDELCARLLGGDAPIDVRSGAAHAFTAAIWGWLRRTLKASHGITQPSARRAALASLGPALHGLDLVTGREQRSWHAAGDTKEQAQERARHDWQHAWRRTVDTDPSPWMFPADDGGPTHPHAFSQAFERRVGRCGAPRARLHDLRHTHATLLIKHGVPVKVVSERLGHAKPAFTIDTYQSIMPGIQADAARAFETL